MEQEKKILKMIDRSKLVFQNKNFKVVDGAAGITFDFVVFDEIVEINMKKISTEFVVNGECTGGGLGGGCGDKGGYGYASLVKRIWGRGANWLWFWVWPW